jgi:hypothetical protein
MNGTREFPYSIDSQNREASHQKKHTAQNLSGNHPQPPSWQAIRFNGRSICRHRLLQAMKQFEHKTGHTTRKDIILQAI